MIKYNLFFRQPQLHYVDIELVFKTDKNKEIELYMPTWTPGSYMIREYSKNITQLHIYNKEQHLIPYTKTSKNTWSFYADSGSTYYIRYQVYCNEISVRTNHVDGEHALLNGAATFITIKGYENERHDIYIKPHSEWDKISSALLSTGNKWERHAVNYDELVDSPIEIGNQEVIHFEVKNVSHELAIVGRSNIPTEKVVADLKLIIEKELLLIAQPHPCKRYVFILIHTDQIYGGLEHKNSSVNMVDRWNYTTREKYLQVISLLAHEYFHLWNVKHFRPVELGPFNYHEENYTRQLWSVEGVNSYYDDYFVYWAGVCSRKEYLDIVAKNINTTINTAGDKLQSLTESSFDAWIKYYHKNENSNNTQVNYYVKGAAVSTALNLLILDKTQGEKSLDDVIRALYSLYLQRPERGYTEEEFLSICEEVGSCHLKDFFKLHIYGTTPIDYAYYLSLAGLKLIENKANPAFYLGWKIENKAGRFILTQIENESDSAKAGLNTFDEILSIDGYRMESDWEKFLSKKKEKDRVKIIVSRYGIVKNFELTLTHNQKKSHSIEEIATPDERQLKIRNCWLKKG
ncbi:MAG: PDZ domain-containing protein [Chitinophagales bacterium]|nr:PDZ domain-containing protein [Chitinophagales bacterium]